MKAGAQFFASILFLAVAGWFIAGVPAGATERAGSTQAIRVATATSSAAFSPLSPGEGDTALNWSGYVATGETYTSVSATWQVPEVANENGESADATWVGIGGTVTNDLIQAGTEAIPTYDGSLEYRAWTEALPSHSKPVPLSISPGDIVSVSIQYQGDNTWEISFVNRTTGQTYDTSIEYASTFSSAEWIEEMPVAVHGLISLDDFGAVQFEDARATVDGESMSAGSAGATPLIMTNDQDEPVAIPTELGQDGASFEVSRAPADATPLSYSSDTSDLSGYASHRAAHRHEWLLGF